MSKTSEKIWYNMPASKWEEAIPVGNGYIGGMITGEIETEHIYLNEDSFWYGGFRDRNNPDALENLPKIREMILNGEPDKAEKLTALALSGVPQSQRHYLPAGDLFIKTGHKNETDSYTRLLDMGNGISTVNYSIKGVSYTREYFINYPSNVFIIRFTADKANSINLEFHFDRSRYIDEVGNENGNSIYMTADAGGKDGVFLVNYLSAESEDGKIYTIGENLIAENCTSVTAYLSLSTTFRHESPMNYCRDTINNAKEKGFFEIKQEHEKDYKNLFERVSLDLYSENDNDLTTDKERENVDFTTESNNLIEKYFNFGRYLLISSSREGTLPANLQGIWNHHFLPPWDSKYTININAEMNYWSAETLNLSECHTPLFDLIERMRENGRVTAEKMYGCRGFCAHHNTDIWGDTAPQDICLSSTYWVMGAAWLCLHLVEHYNFTCDLEFAKKSYPTIKEACRFLLDFMVEHNGQLVTVPSISPENMYIMPDGRYGMLTYSPAMDTQIAVSLFKGCKKIASDLNINSDFIDEIEKAESKMPPAVKIGSDGRIMEWIEEYGERERGHRHISHLFALYPSDIVGDDETMLAAARKSLETRLSAGGGHTGWSMAWIINMWARLRDGEKLFECIIKLLKNSTLPNLLDNHPPFQIDGNFGAVAGIAEALVQSHNGYIELLPALPSEWKNGHIKGFVARGGFEIEMAWKDSKIIGAKIKSIKDCEIGIKYNGICKTLNLSKDKIFSL